MSLPTARKLVFRVILVSVSVLLALLVFEIGFRIQSLVHDMRLHAALGEIRDPEPVREGAAVGLAQSIRFSANSRIVYEMIPDLSVVFRGIRLRTDGNGFRVTPHGPPVEEDSVRLIGIGDSFMFGWDVEAEDCYLSLLSRRLNSRAGGKPWHITNTAVPGYNTVMQVEAFKEKALSLKPDMVLVHFVINDMGLPNFIVRRASIFSLRRSFLRERFQENFENRMRGTERLVRLPADIEAHHQDAAMKVPDEYRDMVGPEPYLGAMDELKALSLEHSFSVIVLCDLTAPPIVRRVCRELSFPLIETVDEVKAHLQTTGRSDYFESDLILGKDDTHPSVTGHRLIAGVLEKSLENWAGTVSAYPR
jgi:hypothetical protein